MPEHLLCQIWQFFPFSFCTDPNCHCIYQGQSLATGVKEWQGIRSKMNSSLDIVFYPRLGQMRSGVAQTSLESCKCMRSLKGRALSFPWQTWMLCHLSTHHSGWETFQTTYLTCFPLFSFTLSCVSFQGVPEVDPGTHKYKAPSQPQTASQTAPKPATAAATNNFNPTQIPTVTGPITANPEQVTVTYSLLAFRYLLKGWARIRLCFKTAFNSLVLA